MASFDSQENQPWHEETEFENLTRIMVGATSADDITTTIWSECRRSSESVLLAGLLDDPHPHREMLHRVPGELIPQYGKLNATASYTHTILMGDMVTTPAAYLPNLWRNLSIEWPRRFEATALVKDTDYTLSGNDITIPAAVKGEVYVFEYEHTLNPVPPFIRTMSIMLTAESALLATFGTDHRRVTEWAATRGDMVREQLKMLNQSRIQIHEFTKIKLYQDWDEAPRRVVDFPLKRV